MATMNLHNQILLLVSLSLAVAVQAIRVPSGSTNLSPFSAPEPSTPAPSLVPKQPSGVDTGLVEICKLTRNAQLCEETIGSKLKPGEKVTPMAALVKEIEALSEESKQAQQESDRAKATDPDNAESYEECSTLFKDSKEDLISVTDALSANDMPTARIKLSGAMTYYSTCNESFEEAGKDSPIAKTTARLEKLASNCLAIAAFIAGDHSS